MSLFSTNARTPDRRERPEPEAAKIPGPRVPPNLFAIALGVAGLAEAWHAAVPLLGTPQAVPGALSVLGAALWLILAGAYLAQGPRIILADLRDPVLSPFVSASALTAMVLSAALAQHAFTAWRVLVIVFLAVTIGLGGWLTGQLMTGGIEPDSVHTGYFLPTAAGGLIGANAAAQVGLHALAEASFGIGVISWALLGSTTLSRLFSRPALPNPLVPTMAIELGVSAVAGSAYFALAGQTASFAACVLGGYALIWLTITEPPGATGDAIAVIVLLTAFASWIAFRTVVLAVRGQLFPAWPPVHQAVDQR